MERRREIKAKSPVEPVKVIGLDHAQLAAPPGSEVATRRFFGELLGLIEVEKAEELRARGGTWFALGAQQLAHRRRGGLCTRGEGASSDWSQRSGRPRRAEHAAEWRRVSREMGRGAERCPSLLLRGSLGQPDRVHRHHRELVIPNRYELRKTARVRNRGHAWAGCRPSRMGRSEHAQVSPTRSRGAKKINTYGYFGHPKLLVGANSDPFERGFFG